MRTNMGTLTVPRDPQQLFAAKQGKTKDISRPLLICGLNQWIGSLKISSQATDQRRGAADRDEYREAAGAIAQVVNSIRKLLVDASGLAQPLLSHAGHGPDQSAIK